MHSVPVSDGHGMVVDSVEIDGHTVRRANLVLAAVAAANALGVVILAPKVLTEYVVDSPGSWQQLLVPA